MQFILISIVAGLIGTGGMTLVLWGITRSGWAHADMVRAIGSAFTRSYETSLKPGLLIHFGAGIPFAMIYLFALSLLNLNSFISKLIAGGFVGFWHGFAFSFVMVILAEHHPVDKFKNAGFQVAAAHFLAHIVFGLLVGLVMAILGYGS